MSNYGHIQRITTMVGGKTCNFRSKLEYKYAVYLELLKEQGLIEDWFYEPPELAIEFEHGRYGNMRKYLPDFAVTVDGVCEVHETKGRFQPMDATKLKKYSEQYDNPIVLIFGHLSDCKSMRAQYNRARRLEKHIKRVIYDANKSLFKPISHMFDY